MMDPIAFSLFGLQIRWYGISIASALVISIFMCLKRAEAKGISGDKVLDIILWSVPVSIIGARLYYVFFNWHNYKGDLLSIINIRQGGLATHGALIFAIITGYILCKIKKLNFLQMFDLSAPCIALGQAVGRWGNYFNGEAHGGPTQLPWGIYVDGVKVHPTFLYESLWCLLLFAFLIFFDNYRHGKSDKRVSFHGQIAFLYMGLYSFERFFVEGLRTDSLMLGDFKQAQLLSGAVIISSILLYIFYRKKQKNMKKYI